MATAQDLINKSAKQAGILPQGQTLEAGVNSDALDILNLMIASMRNDGIDLGVPKLVASDTIIIDDADEEALKISLTLRLMLEFRRPIQPGLSEVGRIKMAELQAKYSTINEMVLDRALTRKYLPRKRTFDSTDF